MSGIRWTPQRKAALVQDFGRGEVTLADVVSTHQVPAREFLGWCEAWVARGLVGLAVGRKLSRRQAGKGSR